MAALAVCLTPLHAQTVAAKVIVLNGQVSLERDHNAQALFEGNAIAPKQVVVTGPDGYVKFQVSDGSTFEVFPNARVTFRADYPSWTELIQVWLGRIRVQIDHSKGDNPNSVSTPTAVISVRGTIFDVVVQDEDATTLVSVEEGLVEVKHRLQPNGAKVLLHTGESLTVFRTLPLARTIDKTPIIRQVLNATREAVYDVMLRRTSTSGTGTTGSGTAGSGSSGSTQGDQGKTGGTTTGTPGAPTTTTTTTGSTTTSGGH